MLGSTTWYRPLRPEGSETVIVLPLPPPLTLLLMLPLLGLLVSPLLELECRTAASAAVGWGASSCAGCADDRERDGMIVCP